MTRSSEAPNAPIAALRALHAAVNRQQLEGVTSDIVQAMQQAEAALAAEEQRSRATVTLHGELWLEEQEGGYAEPTIGIGDADLLTEMRKALGVPIVGERLTFENWVGKHRPRATLVLVLDWSETK